MPTQIADTRAITFERAYPGTADQPRRCGPTWRDRRAVPVADELVLLTSELAANAVSHSRSGHPGGTFTVRATLYPGDYAWIEVIDQGGPWAAGNDDVEHGRGLAVVAAIAGDGNWGIEGDNRGARGVVPARLAAAVSQPKYMQVAARIRVQIAAGLLMPGEAAPSGAALARVTGYSHADVPQGASAPHQRRGPGPRG